MSKNKSILAMCCYDTYENDRTKYTKATLENLLWTVDWRDNEFYIVNQNSIEATDDAIKEFIRAVGIRYGEDYRNNIHVIHLDQNIGTARGINLCLKHRGSRHCIKADNDIAIDKAGWVEEMELVVDRFENEENMLSIGAIALKRPDLIESTYHPDLNFRSIIHTVPHIPGEVFRHVEQVRHLMGTCCMYTNTSLSKINALYQMSNYGFDDSIYSIKNEVLGLMSCFLLGFTVHHLDDGSNSYTKEKQDSVSKDWSEYERIGRLLMSKQIPVWQDFY